MPIYAYKCSACGFAKDALQKMSDAPLTVCPNCGASTFEKQVTAAGFQLKGSGWYVTDFREGSAKAGAAKPDAKPAESSGSGTPEPSSTPAPAAGAATPAPAPAAAPAPAPTPSKSD
ncbi:MAG: zinc ribbon domain-containing protein [Comamonadaceae bacterium]|nr:MAG: zinc ribbon domain-containing protein [Comamonadaceae bacterium]